MCPGSGTFEYHSQHQIISRYTVWMTDLRAYCLYCRQQRRLTNWRLEEHEKEETHGDVD